MSAASSFGYDLYRLRLPASYVDNDLYWLRPVSAETYIVLGRGYASRAMFWQEYVVTSWHMHAARKSADKSAHARSQKVC